MPPEAIPQGLEEFVDPNACWAQLRAEDALAKAVFTAEVPCESGGGAGSSKGPLPASVMLESDKEWMHPNSYTSPCQYDAATDASVRFRQLSCRMDCSSASVCSTHCANSFDHRRRLASR